MEDFFIDTPIQKKTNKYTVLKQFFGYDSFRDGQEFIIDNILNGKDMLGVMPTGAGKSICFQIPAMMLDGITIVISPLISLMKDQVNALMQVGINAVYLNSSLSISQYNVTIERACENAYKIIYVAPERLFAEDFLYFAKTTKISMLTVDEAHCISQWGQDFRPSYTRIVEFIEKLPTRPVVSAFTATATEQVRTDIVESLNLKLNKDNILVTGFNRKNLYFEVRKPKDKLRELLGFLNDRRDKSGIVYCSTRKSVEDICSNLTDNGYSATRYHAGLSDIERAQNQDAFIFDRFSIIVATNAFGMGIDKSNVSFVVHFNMPKNIESYYQEAGRAGRDGQPADCLLLFSSKDVSTNTFLIENTTDSQYADPETELLIKTRDRERLQIMTFYCHTNECLRSYIIKYFGEDSPSFCGNCGTCNDNHETVDITIDSQKILSCVARAGERFGVAIITKTLIGSKDKRIIGLGLNMLSTYGIMKENSVEYIREVINNLILLDYLTITIDKFPVLKLDINAKKLLFEGEKLKIKCSETSSSGSNNKSNSVGRFTGAPSRTPLAPVNSELFTALKTLRFKIATEQKLPAFVIFSDSTLTDMCMKLPKNSDELLNVSGVGQVKLDKYGSYFLEEISKYLEKKSLSDDSDSDNENIITNNSIGGEITTVGIADEPITISIITDRINCYLLQNNKKKLSSSKINDWLISEQLLELVTDENGKNSKVPTEYGLESGIFTVERFIRGQTLNINMYNKEMQKLIADNFVNSPSIG